MLPGITPDTSSAQCGFIWFDSKNPDANYPKCSAESKVILISSAREKHRCLEHAIEEFARIIFRYIKSGLSREMERSLKATFSAYIIEQMLDE